MAIDVAATAIPFIPGGAATALKASRAVNTAVDAVSVVNKVDNVVDAAKTAERIDDAFDLGKQLDDVPCLFNSFSAETLVLTEDGPRPISELVEGDRVYAWNEVTQRIERQPILDTISHHDPSIVRLTLEGETLETTDEHPFYIVEESEWSSYLSVGKWVEAGALQSGDDARRADGTTGEVVSVQMVAQSQWMYNLTVETAHTFFVGQGQWLV